MPAVNRRQIQLASALLILIAAGCLALFAGARAIRTPVQPSPPARLAALPNRVLWTWERPEDLRFLKTTDTAAVAFLAETVTLPSPTAKASVRQRLQPLRVAPGTPLIAVVRIESPANRTSLAQSSAVNAEFRAQLATQIASLQSLAAVRAIQIDFDATSSQRDFYSALLQNVRRELRPDIPLSITALASWCIGDSWLNTLPLGTIDEAVPMLFRMGVDAANVAKFLRANSRFPVAACNGSLGLSTDEAVSRSILSGEFAGSVARRSEKRIYVFAPHPWTELETSAILQELHR